MIVSRRVCFLVGITMLFLAYSVTALSQGNFWTELNGFAGFSGLQEGSGGKLFGNRENGVLYISTDNGITWREGIYFTGQMSELVARNSNIFVSRLNFSAQNFFQLHLSTDNGITWTRFSTFSDQTRSHFMVSDSGEIYCYYRGIFFGQPFGPFRLSKFQNNQWVFVNSPLPNTLTTGTNSIGPVIIDHQNNFYAGSLQNGLYISRDEGATWEQQFADRGITALTVTPENHIYFAGDPSTGSGGIQKSTDNGVTWKYLGLPDNTITSISVNPDGVPVAATDQGIYRRNPADGSWEFTSPVGEQFNATLATSSNTIIATNYTTGIFRTYDGGKTWAQSGPRQRDVYAIHETSSGKILAGTFGGRIFTSTDGGGNWDQIGAGSMCDNVYAFSEQHGYLYAGTECGLFRSSDDGTTWSEISSDVLQGVIPTIVSQMDGDLLTGSLFGVQRSTDDGLTWEERGLQQSSILSLGTDNNGGIFAVTDDDGLFYSQDDGLNWEQRGISRNDLQTVNVNNAGTVFVGIYGGILRSTNGGVSWVEKRFSLGYVNSIAFLGADIYAGAWDGVFVSHDNGESWGRLNSSGLAYQQILSLAFNSNGFLFAGTYNGGVFRTTGTLTDVAEAGELPASFKLLQNYPNPFNPSTEIEFHIPSGSDAGIVKLAVYDVLGREVSVLVNERFSPGMYKIRWNAERNPSGVYYCRLQAGSYNETKKMLLLH